MLLFALPFPTINPILFELGPLKVHWYGVAYVVGILLGWRYALYLARNFTSHLKPEYFDDFVTWVVVGIVAGGRLGHIFIYEFSHYLYNPLEILMTWKGGMSFYGGLLGVIISTLIYCKRKGINPLEFADVVAAVVPIGLGLGRIANFINGELYGRISYVPWAIEFPQGGGFPRHPSQLYEAFLEGLVLWLVLAFAWHRTSLYKTPGRIAGLFLIGYAASRFLVEYVREPDVVYHLASLPFTTGQLLALPMIAMGALWLRSRKA